MTHLSKSAWRRYCVACASMLLGAVAHAQQEIAKPLTQGGDMVTLPGVGRVVLAFLLVAGLAVVIVVLLKRVLPKFSGIPATSGSLRVVDRVDLGSGLRVYTLESGNEKVLLAAGRNGLALTVLTKSREAA